MSTTTPVSAPVYRPVTTRVLRTRRLGASFVRVTLGGPELAGFGHAGADQRIKLLLPPRAGAPVRLPPGDGSWYESWLAAPVETRPLMRTFTVRGWRPGVRELDVDFAVHGAGGGPASSWACGARVGDELVVLGPDRPGRGRMWGREFDPPADAHVLLLGDETAVPAVCAILEELADGPAATALLEVPTAADDLGPVGGHDVVWLPREGTPRGERLTAALVDLLGLDGPAGSTAAPAVPEPDPEALLWEVPESPTTGDRDLHVWLAGEAGVVRSVRRLLLGPAGLPRSAVAFMGYWREGTAG